MDENYYYGIGTGILIGLLIAAIVRLQSRIEKLEKLHQISTITGEHQPHLGGLHGSEKGK